MSRPPTTELAEAVRHHQAGRLAEAVQGYERVLQAGVARAEIWLNLGLALRAQRRSAEALTAFQQASQLDPLLAEAHHQAGNVLKQLGRYQEAVSSLRRATELAPRNAAAWLNRGVAQLDSEQTSEAVASFRHAVALEPNRAEAHNILGVALTASGQLDEARHALEQALRLRPAFAAAHNNLARLAKAEGQLPEAIREYRAALASAPDAQTHSNLLYALNFVAGLSPAAVTGEHRRWQELYAPQRAAAPVPRWPQARRLRIGYVSPDFVHHAVAYFIAPVLAAHTRNRVEVFAYSNTPRPDPVTQRLQGLAEHWRDIARLDDDHAAEIIRADELDLLIDLAGHTARNRLGVFARRPAPVQATWIGYPNTTGLNAIDYRITDAISDPVGTTEAFHSEKLVRLPGPFSCYEPDDRAPAVSALPAQTSGQVVFGCFNNFAKISPEVVATWASLLTRIPSARLLLKSRGLGDAGVMARVRDSFAQAGVTAERLKLDGRELSVQDHLACYAAVDIALDPFPYNGTTTTCEALWMGVPVVALAGATHAARVGASLLTHVGIADWIAPTPAAYVDRAAAAAQDLGALRRLRENLRERMRQSPLCDAAGFTHAFEDLCETMAARKA